MKYFIAVEFDIIALFCILVQNKAETMYCKLHVENSYDAFRFVLKCLMVDLSFKKLIFFFNVPSDIAITVVIKLKIIEIYNTST